MAVARMRAGVSGGGGSDLRVGARAPVCVFECVGGPFRRWGTHDVVDALGTLDGWNLSVIRLSCCSGPTGAAPACSTYSPA